MPEMPFNAVYDVATGALRSSGYVVASDADLSAKGLAKKVFPAAPADGSPWNAGTLTWDAAPTPVVALTPGAFLQRFTADERIAIRGQRAADAYVDDFLDLLSHATEVRSDDRDVIDGLDRLVAAGLLTGERRAEILS